MSRSHRAFIAFSLSDGVTAEIQNCLHDLKQSVPSESICTESLRWIPDSNWHLTLAFLGDQKASVLDKLWRNIHSRIASVSAFAVPIESICAFPDATSPILAAQVVLTEDLSGLREGVARQCGDLGILLDSRLFRPHITLARAKQAIQPGSQWALPPDLGMVLPTAIPFICHDLVLYVSERSVTGSRYHRYASIDLV